MSALIECPLYRDSTVEHFRWLLLSKRDEKYYYVNPKYICLSILVDYLIKLKFASFDMQFYSQRYQLKNLIFKLKLAGNISEIVDGYQRY